MGFTLTSKFKRVIEDIRLGRIQSGTNAVVAVLDVIDELADVAENKEELLKGIELVQEEAIKARPANVLMTNLLARFSNRVKEKAETASFEELKDVVHRACERARKMLVETVNVVAAIASNIVEKGDVIMTFSYSTIVAKALANAQQKGKAIEVFIAESRPGSEGLKMAEELEAAGIPVTLFVDSATRYFMKNVDKVFIGVEAIAANGAVVSKVGTSCVALAAHEARVTVFALAPTLKLSPRTMFGELVELMEGEAESLLPDLGDLAGYVSARCPLFDVTPPEYIDAIITERGLLAPQAVSFILSELYGWPPHAGKRMSGGGLL